MPEELKELIEKINREGVEAAEEKARSVEAEARRKAVDILKKAEREAGSMIESAKRDIARMEESAKESLKQAGRDLILTLKKEVNEILGKIISSNVREALDPHELARIIASLIKDFSQKDGEGVIISLRKDDLEKVEKLLLAELKGDLKKTLTLKASDAIGGGFIISYDSGKSCYDFTDRALAEYLSAYLKPKLAELFKE